MPAISHWQKITLFLFFLALPFASLATQNDKVQPKNYLSLPTISSQIFGNNFSSDPTREGRVAATTIGSSEKLEIFLINKNECAIAGDSYTYRVMVRNEGDQVAQNLEVRVGYAGGTELLHTFRPADEVNPLLHEIIWREPALVPGAFVEYAFTIKLIGGQVRNVASVEFDWIGGRFIAVTEHTIDGTCQIPRVQPTTLPQKLAAIICDASETACRNFLPDLGQPFQNAQNPAQQPRVCSNTPYNRNNCQPNKPQLGVPFRQATPTILPGECRVVEDEVPSANQVLLGTRAETSWCESNGYPQFVLSGAPQPAKGRQVSPPDTSRFNGYFTSINQSLVAGTPCGGRPGDPWWAPLCQCQCNEPYGGSICQAVLPITRHDIFVTSQQECLLEGAKHVDPFF